MLKVECSPCGETLFAPTEAELVELTRTHAQIDHHVELSREDILAMVQPVV